MTHRYGTGDARDEKVAWDLGVEYGERHRLADLIGPTSEGMYRDALKDGGPPRFFDVFKYGAQSVWRRRGEMPGRRDRG